MLENRYLRVDIKRYPYKLSVSTRFYEHYKRNILICRICERRCHIPPGYSGICGNYSNHGGSLWDIGYGYLSAIESRPIEVKPLFHFHPNSTALTFSGWGCNFHCPWCQNYRLSMAKPIGDIHGYVPPDRIIRVAVEHYDDGVCGSFNEPSIHLEYLLDVFRLAKKRGLYTTMVSNGYMSLDACKALIDAGLDGLNIDIKGCPDSHRRELRGIDPEIVYRNASLFKEHDVHVEMVYLVVPGFNDDEKCFDWIIDMHLRHLGADTPLHINRYQRAYKYKARATSISLLERYYESAMKMGLKYVYLGNIWNPKYESTYCPRCKYRVIYRSGNRVRGAKLLKNRCANCGYNILLTGEISL